MTVMLFSHIPEMNFYLKVHMLLKNYTEDSLPSTGNSFIRNFIFGSSKNFSINS